MMSSAKSVRSDIICAINRDDSRRGLGRTTTPHAPIGPSHLLNDAANSLKESTRMSGTSLLRNPSQTFFKKEILPSSSDLSVEDGHHLQIIKPFELASVEGDTPLQDGKEAERGSSLDEEKNSTENQVDGAGNGEDKGSEKSDSGKSDCGSLDTGSNASLQTHPVEPSSPPTTPEDKDVVTAAGDRSPVCSPHEAESFSGTSSNIDFELEIFVDKEKASPREAENTVQTSEEKGDKGEGDAPDAAKEAEEPKERIRGASEGSHRTQGRDRNESEAQLLPSVLRSKEGGRARSSSVGHKVRFTGQCSFGESDNDPASVQDDSRASRRPGRRQKRKVHRSG